MFISTRSQKSYSLRDCVLKGRPEDGGYFVPENLPELDAAFLDSLSPLRFTERLARILGLFAPEISEVERRRICERAFPEEHFGERAFCTRPLNPYRGREYYAASDDGPSGFLQDYPIRLGLAALEEWVPEGEIYALCSGLTLGSRLSLAAQRDLAPTLSRLYFASGDQALSLEEEADREVAREGVEDETTAKSLTAFKLGRDQSLAEICYNRSLKAIQEQGEMTVISLDGSEIMAIITAIACLISAYVDVAQDEHFRREEPLDLALPALDLSWILADIYAKAMGLPLGLCVCTAGPNHILSDFLKSGRYQIKQRPKVKGDSEWQRFQQPNLERLVFEMSGRRGPQTAELLEQLTEEGFLQMDKSAQMAWKEHLLGFQVEEAAVLRRMKKLYDESDYLLDSYTATALLGHELERHSRDHDVLLLGTARPQRTARSCAEAIFGKGSFKGRSEAEMARELQEEAGLKALTGESKWSYQELPLADLGLTEDSLLLEADTSVEAEQDDKAEESLLLAD